MTAGKWSDVPVRTRRLVVTAAVVDGVLKIAALVDIKRRPAGQIRGSKWMWAVPVLLINSAGVLPVAYFVIGRRRLAPGIPQKSRNWRSRGPGRVGRAG